MAAACEKLQERDQNVDRTADDADQTIAVKDRSLRHQPRRVRFNDPDSVVDDVFAFHALALQDDIETQRVVCASLDSCQQLEILAEESVARPRE